MGKLYNLMLKLPYFVKISVRKVLSQIEFRERFEHFSDSYCMSSSGLLKVDPKRGAFYII